jgi:hypothetical protein
MALRDTRERQSSAAPHAVRGQGFERVRGTRRVEPAGAAGERREQQLIRADDHQRGTNAGSGRSRRGANGREAC